MNDVSIPFSEIGIQYVGQNWFKFMQISRSNIVVFWVVANYFIYFSRAQPQFPTDKGLSSSISIVPSTPQHGHFVQCILQQLVINNQYWCFICTDCA